jgi:hypothetical protein
MIHGFVAVEKLDKMHSPINSLNFAAHLGFKNSQSPKNSRAVHYFKENQECLIFLVRVIKVFIAESLHPPRYRVKPFE